MTPKTQFPGIHAPRNVCNSNNLGFLSSQLRDQKCVLTSAIPRQIIDSLIINKLFVLVLLMIVVIIIVVIIIKAAHEQEPQSPPVGFVPQRAIFRTKFREKHKGGTFIKSNDFSMTFDRPLISMHKIKLNNGGRVQFYLELTKKRFK